MAQPLQAYQQKRNFAGTPEPAQGGAPSPDALQLVVHKHWARSLHYDLRLELDGTMKSWAVPKGPSYDPADKRMAVQVEDHPIAYNTFEGEIPAGEYGGGTVILWDRGHWTPLGDPQEGYRQGKLKFELHGHKLQGRWTLVRMRGRASDKQPAWLWIKEHDGLERLAADYSVVDALPDSVNAPQSAAPAAARKSAQKAAGTAAQAPRGHTDAPTPARNSTALPASFSPQLATLVDAPPSDVADWLFELKFDGYRLLARCERGQVQLFTRNGNDWTAKMAPLAAALAQAPLRSGWIDGEVVVLDAQGRPDFQALQNAFDGEKTQPLVYCVFDLPYADGQDLRALPLVQRRERLRALVARMPSEQVRFSEAFDAPPLALVASACQLGFEGVIGKRRSAPYASARNADWIKLKCSHRQEFVIGGFTDPQGTRTGLGALLLGVHRPDGALEYTGNVGTGFNARTLAELRARLAALETAHNPFAHPGAVVPRKAHWVQPTLVAEVSFGGWTASGRVRHAVFRGLRSDKPATAIERETPQHLAAPAPGPRLRSAAAARGAASAVAGQQVTHPERVLDAQSGCTKLDLVRYYAAVAPLMLAHLSGRPVALLRAPEGVAGERFFQKHLDSRSMPGVAALVPKPGSEHPAMLQVTQARGLLSAAQMNVIEFHTGNAHKDRLDRPDRMCFDLDPGEHVAWSAVQEAAHLVQVLLTELGLPAFLKTSGGKGLHVVVPIQRRHGWDTVKGFSQAVVQHLAQTIPQRFVAQSGPRNRIGKVFVDYLRNGMGATTACAWTARARPGMGVSVPLAWSELPGLTSSAHWHLRNVAERLPEGNARWEGYAGAAVSIAGAMKALGYRTTPPR